MDEGEKMSATILKKAALTASIFCAIGAGQVLAAEHPAEPMEDDSLATMINKYVSLIGLIELEASWGEDFEGASESSIDLSTMELGLEAQMTDWVTGNLLLEWDGDDDKVTVADAFVTIGDSEEFPLTLTGGRLTVPFGLYETNMVSDPFTLEIGETGEDVLMINYDQAGVYGRVYVFNGDTNEGGGDSNIEQFGATVGYAMENDAMSLDAGLGYISSLLDSDGLSDAMPDGMESDYVGGIAAHVVIGFGDFVLIGEIVAGLDDAVEVSGADVADGSDDTAATATVETITNHGKPSAWNAEAAYTFGESEVTIAVGVQGTKNLGGILPETRFLSTVGFELAEGLSLAFQYAHDEDYDVINGGTGDSADSVTTLLSYEF